MYLNIHFHHIKEPHEKNKIFQFTKISGTHISTRSGLKLEKLEIRKTKSYYVQKYTVSFLLCKGEIHSLKVTFQKLKDQNIGKNYTPIFALHFHVPSTTITSLVPSPGSRPLSTR